MKQWVTTCNHSGQGQDHGWNPGSSLEDTSTALAECEAGSKHLVIGLEDSLAEGRSDPTVGSHDEVNATRTGGHAPELAPENAYGRRRVEK